MLRSSSLPQRSRRERRPRSLAVGQPAPTQRLWEGIPRPTTLEPTEHCAAPMSTALSTTTLALPTSDFQHPLYGRPVPASAVGREPAPARRSHRRHIRSARHPPNAQPPQQPFGHPPGRGEVGVVVDDQHRHEGCGIATPSGGALPAIRGALLPGSRNVRNTELR